jgi:uncharacterized protein DUF4340
VTRNALLCAGAFLSVSCLVSCSAGGRSTSRVPVVVPGRATAWTSIAVTAGTRTSELPAELKRPMAPLLASRALTRPSPLTEYGLDRPAAHVTYRAAGTGAVTTVDLGAANFDRHFVYAQRRGRATVYLVPADTLRPVLALVAIDVAPPD